MCYYSNSQKLKVKWPNCKEIYWKSSVRTLEISFLITKMDDIKKKLFQYCSSGHVYFLVLPQQSSLLGLQGPVLPHLLGTTGKCSPSCQINTRNQLFQYCPIRKDNTRSITYNYIRTQVGIYGEFQHKPSENPSGSAHGISFMLRVYFTVYPSSRHNTDTFSITKGYNIEI